MKAPDVVEQTTVTHVLSTNPHAKFSGKKTPPPEVTASVAADATAAPTPASPRSPR